MERTILERRDAIVACERVLDAARGGSGGVVLIEGRPGIGKSSVLRAAREAAAARGITPWCGCTAERAWWRRARDAYTAAASASGSAACGAGSTGSWW